MRSLQLLALVLLAASARADVMYSMLFDIPFDSNQFSLSVVVPDFAVAGDSLNLTTISGNPFITCCTFDGSPVDTPVGGGGAVLLFEDAGAGLLNVRMWLPGEMAGHDTILMPLEHTNLLVSMKFDEIPAVGTGTFVSGDPYEDFDYFFDGHQFGAFPAAVSLNISTVVPEPSTFLLLAAAMLTLLPLIIRTLKRAARPR